MAYALPDWMMLDTFVFRRDDDSSFPDYDTASFRAQGISSHGGPFTVALRIVQPPAISRFYLQWPGGPKDGSRCLLVAAHRNLLLFRLTYSPVKEDDESLISPQEYFICEGGPNCPLQLNPISICTLRYLHPQAIGMLCGGEEKYTIAQLRLSESDFWEKKKAELCILRSNKWKLLRNLRIKHQDHEFSEVFSWRTDKVICFQNYLCWVSYFSGGILLCDVLEKKPEVSYLRLPIHNRSDSIGLHRVEDINCSLCISDNKLMFIALTSEDNEIVSPRFLGNDFIVSCHTLRTEESSHSGMVWEQIHSIKSHELSGFNASPPHDLMMFPLVSMNNSNELHFLLSKDGERGINKVWVVVLNTLNNGMEIHQYIKGEIDLGGEDDDMVRQKSHFLRPFIPSEFPKFLSSARAWRN